METFLYILLVGAWSGLVLNMLRTMYDYNYMDGIWLTGIIFMPHFVALYYYFTKITGLGGNTWGYKGIKARAETRPWQLTKTKQLRDNITLTVVVVSCIIHFTNIFLGINDITNTHSYSQYLCDTRISDKETLRGVESTAESVLGVRLKSIEYVKPAPEGKYWTEDAVLCVGNAKDGSIHYFVADLGVDNQSYTIHEF